MFKKKNETGRSMVEMLGVLAIIGVLSIGGIAGYTMSMRKHRANQVADVLNKYAMILYSNCQRIASESSLVMTGCGGSSQILTLQEADLPAIPEISGFADIWVNLESTPNSVYFTIDFHEPAICKAVASVTGYNSGPCNPVLLTEFKFE